MTHPWRLNNYVKFFESEKLTHKEWENLYYSEANVLANIDQV